MVKPSELYGRLRRRNQERWGTDRFAVLDTLAAHIEPRPLAVVFELLQNAEDAGATRLGFKRSAGGLLAWNDGRPFEAKDVEGISGIFASQKELLELGYFGIGFKSVLKLSDRPHVLSGDYAFRLEGGLDPYPAAAEDFPPEVRGLLRSEPDLTIFWLPWRNPGRGPQLLAEMEAGLAACGDELLLFLSRLEGLSWEGERYLAWKVVGEEVGEGFRRLKVARRVDGEAEETLWLRFEGSFPIPAGVVDEVLERLRDRRGSEELVRRWQGLRGALLPAAVALPLEADGENFRGDLEGRIFVGLPTEERPGFRFHVGGRFGVSLDRTRTDEQSPLSRWTIGCLGELLGSLPRRLVDAGLFRPSFWKLVPLSGEVRPPFDGPAERLRSALKGGPFFWADDGSLLPVGQVFLGHNERLYGLVSPADLEETVAVASARWVHPELRHGRPKEAVKSFGVGEVGPEEMVSWLEKEGGGRLSGRDSGWLAELYVYLAGITAAALKARVRRLSVLPVGSGLWVPPERAFLPPEAEDVPGALGGLAGRLPVISGELAARLEVREALRVLGVRDFELARALRELIGSRYGQGEGPPPEESIGLVRALWNFWKDDPKDRQASYVLSELSDLPFLRSESGRYVKPEEAYIPPELGGKEAVKKFVAPLGVPFVWAGYRQEGEDLTDWKNFFWTLEANCWPRIHLRDTGPMNRWEAERWLKERDPTRRLPRGRWEYYWGEDVEIEGLREALNLAERGGAEGVEWAQLIWTVLEEVGPDENLARLTCHGPDKIYTVESITSLWVRMLQTRPWLPDEAGRPARPDELWWPELKPKMGPGYRYLHPAVFGYGRRWLVAVLGIRTEAETDAVLANLARLAGTEADREQVAGIYRWLADRRNASAPGVRERFRQEKLIFIPGAGWFSSDQVCWEDPGGVIPSLAGAWEDDPVLKRFFLETLGVAKIPAADHLARTLLETARAEAVPDLARARNLIGHVLAEWDRVDPRLRAELLASPCWPGRKGQAVGWYRSSELYAEDSEAIARLFDGILPFWILKEVEGPALERLGLRRVSAAEEAVVVGADLGPEPECTGRLGELWPLVLWFTGRDEPAAPPEVRLARAVQAFYRLDGSESRGFPVEAHFDHRRGAVFLGPDAWGHPAHHIGKALENGLKADRLREFLKELWPVRDPRTASGILAVWEEELGRPLDLSRPAEMGADTPPPTRKEPGGPESEGFGPGVERRAALADLPPGKPEAPPPAGAGKPWPPRAGSAARKDTGPGIGPGPVSWERARPARPLGDHRAEVARRAMSRVEAWLKGQGYEVWDVSGYGLGYDLEAFRDGVTIQVEVKGLSLPDRVTFTPHEWEQARKFGDRYWLVVAVIYGEDSGLYLIRDPARKLRPEIEERVEIYYQLPRPQWLEASERLETGPDGP
jgi:hypothetical protein